MSTNHGIRLHLLHEALIMAFNDRHVQAQTVKIDILIPLALSGKKAFQVVVLFIKSNCIYVFRESTVCLQYKSALAVEAKSETGFIAFLKFARKIGFYKFGCGDNEISIYGVVELLEKCKNLSLLDLPDCHGIPNVMLRKMGRVFSRVTELTISADSLVLLVMVTDMKFALLREMKVVGNVADINRIAVTPERFPNLRWIEICPTYRSEYAHLNQAKSLVFADNAFPHVQNVCINFHERAFHGFTASDFGVIRRWLKRFPSATRATVSITKYIYNYQPEHPEDYSFLYDASRTVNFGIPIEVSFTVDGGIHDPNNLRPIADPLRYDSTTDPQSNLQPQIFFRHFIKNTKW